MIKRMFQVKVEVEDSQVTLSPSLTAHMLRHNRYGRDRLAVIVAKDGDEYALDVNPPYDVLSQEYQLSSMAEVQYDPVTKDTGFQMDDPSVAGLLAHYGVIKSDETPPPFYMLRVHARRVKGRWLYYILHPSDDVDEWMQMDRHERFTQLLQRFKII